MGLSRSLLTESGAGFAERVYGAEEIALLHELAMDGRPVILDPAVLVRDMRYDTLRGSLKRLYLLGLGSGRMRKAMPLRGSILARCWWLLPLLAPARFVLTAWRTMRCGPQQIIDLVRLTPIVFCQLLSYAIGFARGAYGPSTGDS